MAKLVLGTDINNTGTASFVRDVSPAYYVEYSVDANGKAINSSYLMDFSGITDVGNYVFYNLYANNTSITGNVDFSSLNKVSGNYGCAYMFQGCTGLTNIDLSSLTTVTSQYGCKGMFSGCTGLTSVNLSSLTKATANDGCGSMFYMCTGLTSVDLSSLTTGSNCSMMFYGCSSLTNVDLSSLESNLASQMFQLCTGLTRIELPALTYCNSSLQAFAECSNLVSADLSSLVEASYCQGVFYKCTSLTDVNLSSLSLISGNSTGISYMFSGCTSLTSVSFPAIKSFSSTSQLQYLCSGIPNITLHFPSNMQAKIETMSGYSTTAPFGAVSGTVLFDLPATNTLTGIDNKPYTRNPKYDTATALAWKQSHYQGKVLTPAYYTSGLTDPQVGTTIYSDAACTTPVTTINSIN